MFIHYYIWDADLSFDFARYLYKTNMNVSECSMSLGEFIALFLSKATYSSERIIS